MPKKVLVMKKATEQEQGSSWTKTGKGAVIALKKGKEKSWEHVIY